MAKITSHTKLSRISEIDLIYLTKIFIAVAFLFLFINGKHLVLMIKFITQLFKFHEKSSVSLLYAEHSSKKWISFSTDVVLQTL